MSYQENPLFAMQLKRTFRRLENNGVHMGTGDKLLFTKVAKKRVEDYLKDPDIDGGLDILQGVPHENIAILDGIPDAMPIYIKQYSR